MPGRVSPWRRIRTGSRSALSARHFFGIEMHGFQLAWLRALRHAGGAGNSTVTSRQVVEALVDIERVQGRITTQAASANLSRLMERGLAEGFSTEGVRYWRITDSGNAVLDGSVRIADTPEPAAATAPLEFEEPLLQRLAGVM